MKPWPKHPAIYEINTLIWLRDLSGKYKQNITLSTVPLQEWNCLASLGVDAVWLMGVWQRSPAGVKLVLKNDGMISDFRRALPDLRTEDIVGSPYCVKDYVVDARLGGPEGLASARKMLAKRDLRLILDFVPNHVAPDHPWVTRHPEYFVCGSDEDLSHNAYAYMKTGREVIAFGRDPNFLPWPDVLQLNAFNCGLRTAALDTLSEIACQCDGVRCDMAMLVMNMVFERTWGSRAGLTPVEDYWTELIPAVKRKHRDFKFIAEAYWDLEWDLQQQGFDFCYDKRLYDRIVHHGADKVMPHLNADISYQERLVRFIENHGEQRAASVFSVEKEKMALAAVATLPGAKLYNEGQFQGWKTRLPLYLGRRPEEITESGLEIFSFDLLKLVDNDVFRNGEWKLCGLDGWPDNMSCRNIFSWTWSKESNRYLVVINYSGSPAQANVRIPWDEIPGSNWMLIDFVSGDTFERDGDEMSSEGLYVDMPPWSCHFFRFHQM